MDLVTTREFYVAASIRGGRRRVKTYRFICDLLSTYGHVLTEHVGNVTLTSLGEKAKAD